MVKVETKKKTKEERVAEGEQYIKQREKAASQLQAQGLTLKAAQEQAAQGLSASAEGRTQEDLSTKQVTLQEAQAAQQQQLALKQQQLQNLPLEVFEAPPSTQKELIAGGINTPEGFAQIEQAAAEQTLFPKLRERIDTRSRNAIDNLPN